MIFQLSLKKYLLWGGIFLITLVILYSGCSTKQRQDKEIQSMSNVHDPKPINQDPPDTGVTRGRILFEKLGCMGCHTVNGKGGKVGPDLTDEADKGRSRQWLSTQIKNPKTNDPQTIMPAFNNLSSEQNNDIVDYLMSLSGKKSSDTNMHDVTNVSARNMTVSLSTAGQKWSDICGQCHNLRSPSEYNDDQWTAAIDQMRLLVPLTGQERNEILEFLQASN